MGFLPTHPLPTRNLGPGCGRTPGSRQMFDTLSSFLTAGLCPSQLGVWAWCRLACHLECAPSLHAPGVERAPTKASLARAPRLGAHVSAPCGESSGTSCPVCSPGVSRSTVVRSLANLPPRGQPWNIHPPMLRESSALWRVSGWGLSAAPSGGEERCRPTFLLETTGRIAPGLDAVARRWPKGAGMVSPAPAPTHLGPVAMTAAIWVMDAWSERTGEKERKEERRKKEDITQVSFPWA